MKKLFASVIVFILMGSFASGVTINQKQSVQQSSRGTLYVGGSGPGNYSSIQGAINDANSGDTIFVFNGIYYENVVVDKSINLIGEDKNTTVIDGSGSGDVVYVSSDYVYISGFNISNSGSCPGYYAGIKIINSDFNKIFNNIIYNCCGGVWLQGNNSYIENNTLIENYDGIYLRYANNNSIFMNNCSDNELRGIHLRYDSINNKIRCNIISNNCILTGNFYGIHIRESHNNIIFHNIVKNNNGRNVWSKLYNQWDNDYPSGGNYWDDYSGIDIDGDGIGDTPYNISGGNNQDLYPLMYPWYPTHPDTVFVDDDYNISTPGWGYDKFDRIQYGINEVPEDGTVYVYNGTYYENVDITKDGINLIGEDKNNTIIDGGGTGDVVYVSADYVNITGFIIQKGGFTGIKIINSNFNSITNNKITDNADRGLYIAYSNNNKIQNNIITLNLNIENVRLQNSNYNIICNNIIADTPSGENVILEFSSNNTLCNNYIANSDSASAIQVIASHNNTIYKNIFLNVGEGIYIANSKYNIISDNTINSPIWLFGSCNHYIFNNTIFDSHEDYGIILYGENNDNNTFYNNNLINNSEGFRITSGNNNLIFHNNFINNTQNAYDECNNKWDDGYPSGGNYWSDYPYEDENHGPNQDLSGHDRIGDVPYDLPCEHAIDYYPVMHPYGWLNEAPGNLTIDGPTTGKAGQSYTYTSSAEDLEGDPIYYRFDWGDGSYSDWLGPYLSGTEASDEHSWSKGTFEIKVKAKDTRGLESEWSDPLVVTMPRDKAINRSFLNFLENHPNLFPMLQKIIQQLGQ